MLELIQSNPFYQITMLLTLATIFGMIGNLMKQPMLVGFIIVGALAGPSALGVVESPEHIELLAELGIAILLFLVGLKLDLHLIKTLGAIALIIGLGQVALTAIASFGLAVALGLDYVSSLYVAIAITFSSTIIVVKMLSDKREVDSLHGRIAIGVLIVQDIVVVLAMMILSAIGVGGNADASGEDVLSKVLATLGYGAVMLIFVGIFIRYFAMRLVGRLSHSQELLVTFAIAWAALLAAIGHYFGFGKELGGLLAGISLASTPYREIIIARLHSLRDFLLLFFFIVLGSKIDLSIIGSQVGYALIFVAFVMLFKPLIVMAIMGYMGYRKRTSFLTGITLAQMSEFSLILAAMGLEVGHITPETLGLITLVGLITIALSVYMITYSHELYHVLEAPLDVFERERSKEQVAREDVNEAENSRNKAHYDVIIFGLGRYGEEIIFHLKQHKLRILAVDFNPDVVKAWKERGFKAIYGDGCDQEFIHDLPLKGVRWVISAMPQHDIGITHEDPRYIMIDTLKETNYKGKIIVSTHHPEEEEKLHQRGADLVLMPFKGAARYATEQLMELYGA